MVTSRFLHPFRAPARGPLASTRRRGTLLKLSAVLLGLTLAATACGDDSSGDDAGGTGTGSGGVKGKTIDFVGYGNDNPWGAYFNKVFIKKLEDGGAKVVDLTTMDPGTAV